MAYREFRNEKYYEAPEADFSGTKKAIDGIGDAIVAKKKAEQKTKDDKLAKIAAFKHEAEEGKFEDDIAALKQNSLDVYNEAYAEIGTTGAAGKKTGAKIAEGKAISELSKTQYARMENIKQEIDKRATEDPWYIPDADIKRLNESTRGAGINYLNRGEKMDEAQAGMYGLETFNNAKFMDDFVAKQKVRKGGDKNSYENTGGTTTGHDNTFEGIFVNSKGDIYVSDQDVTNFFNSDASGKGRAEQYYKAQVDKDLAERMKGDKNIPANIAAIQSPEEKFSAYALHVGVDRGHEAREKARTDIKSRAIVSKNNSVTTARDFAQINKKEDEKVVATPAIHNFVSRATKVTTTTVDAPKLDSEGREMKDASGKTIMEKTVKVTSSGGRELYSTTIGRSLSSKNGKGFETTINLHGGINLSPDETEGSSKIKGNVPIRARVATVGYALVTSKTGKIVSRDKQFENEAEAYEFMEDQIRALKPGQKAPFKLTLTAMGDYEASRTTSHSGTAERKKVYDDNVGENVYNTETTKSRHSFAVRATRQVVNDIKVQSGVDVMKMTPEMKRLVDLAKSKNIEIVNPEKPDLKPAPAPATGQKRKDNYGDRTLPPIKKKTTTAVVNENGDNPFKL